MLISKDGINYFKVNVTNETEKWRVDTFWTKEPETIKWIESFQDGDVFYDIGANIGIYSLYFATLYPNGKCYAFEPDINNWNSLCTNTNLNGYTHLKPINVAIHNKCGVLTFKSIKNEAGSAGGELMPYNNLTDNLHSVISALTVDIIFYSNLIPHANHIKIDVDGGEQQIIEGMTLALQNPALKTILIEIDHKKNDVPLIYELFKQWGFTDNHSCNKLLEHSRVRRKAEGIEHIENVVFARA